MTCIGIQELMVKFEADMQFDAHSNIIKFGRSDATGKLVNMGREALPQIIAHLEANPPNVQLEIHICWGMLLHDIALRVKSTETPSTLEDTAGWIAWAKEEVEKLSSKPCTSKGVSNV